MGYERRLYVIEKSDIWKDENGKCWSEVIATFNLCRVNIDFRKYPATESYFYTNNEKVVEDCYGESLKELTIKQAISEIEEAMERDGEYRRWNPILGMLKGFKEREWKDLRVLHYGY